MADKIVAEYIVKTDKAVKNVDDLAKAANNVDKSLDKAGKTAEESFLRGSNGAKRLQAELQKQPKTLAELELRLKRLKELLRDDTNIGTKGFKNVTKEIKNTEKAIDAANGKLKTIGQTSKGLVKQFRSVGAAIGLAFGVHQIFRFGKEAVELASKAEGIKIGFDKLNDATLLDDLRRATRGTVTDVRLMQQAVKADNFNVPLTELANLFDFATKRSTLTGESVDDLTDRIVRGIGTKSSKVLDDLGISLVDIQEELKTTTNFAEAIGNIATREIEKMGDVAETTAIKIARMATAFENLKTSFGSELILQVGELNEELGETAELLGFDGVDGGSIALKLLSNVISEILSPITALNWIVQKNIEAFNLLRGEMSPEEIEREEKAVSDLANAFASMKAAIDDGREAVEETNVEKQIENVFFLKNAIKLLTDEREKEGVSLSRILEINKELKPLNEQLSILLGKETAEQKKLNKELEKKNKLLAEALKLDEDERGDEGFFRIQQESQAEFDAFEEKRKNRLEFDAWLDAQNDEWLARQLLLLDKETAAKRKQQEDIREITAVSLDAALELSSLITNAIIAGQNAELSNLQTQLDQGQITREQYDEKRRKLERKSAIAAKNAAIFQAVINTALAVSNALNTVPFLPLGPIMAGIAAGLGAVQVGVIAGTPLPTFAEGGWVDSKGKIHGNSHAQGGVKIEAEGDEFIVKGKHAKKNSGLLEALNAGDGQDWINKNMVYPAIQNVLDNGDSNSNQWNNLNVQFKDHNLISAMDRDRQANVRGLSMVNNTLNKLVKTQKRGGYNA